MFEHSKMTKLEKLLEKYRQHPESVSAKEMIKILQHHGYQEKGGEWSHTVYVKEGVAEHIVLAVHNNKLKYGYATRYKKILYPNA